MSCENNQQCGQDNFADDQQCGDYGDQSYSDQQEATVGDGDDSNTQNSTNVINLDVPPKSPSDEDRKLFVGGISLDIEQKDLKDYFSKFGEVANVIIKTDPNTGMSRGFAFVTFSSEETVVNVMKTATHNIKGKTIDPKRAKVRPGIKKIFVGGLETNCTEADVKAYFEKYGKVAQVELPFDKVKNQRRQFCFVTFETEDACENACKQAKQNIGTKDCDVKKATLNNPPGDGRGVRGGWGAPVARRGSRGAGYGAQPQSWGAPVARRGGRGTAYGAQPQSWGAPVARRGSRGAGYGAQSQSWGAPVARRGGRGAGYGTQQQSFGAQGYGTQGYGAQSYRNYGDNDYSSYDGGYGLNSAGYGQQINYGKAPRRSGTSGTPATTGGYHPYSH